MEVPAANAGADQSRSQAPRNPPRDMVRIPGGAFEFVVSGIMVEGSDDIGVDVQYPWEDSPRRHHRAAARRSSRSGSTVTR